ncbi:MAG: pilus assembly protein TadG-related protein [Candidatus Omnitrophota bacterium]
MFTYFHDHKNKYNKGQLAPIYILVLVIVIIMAMVTVNLSKVAMVKTDSSNSADAGALATGAIMANAFNSVAVQNNLMMNAYWSAYMSISLAFIIAFYNLLMAYLPASATLKAATTALALQPPCETSCFALIGIRTTYLPLGVAIAKLGKVSITIYAIGISILAASIAQHYNYLIIRRMAIKGRASAIRNGHGFVFSNSGVGSKLKAGSIPTGVTADPQGYRDSYVNFLDGIGDNEYYNYSWKDGQERSHSVDSRVHTDSVGDFKLTVAILPSLAETALLTGSNLLVGLAETSLTETLLDYVAGGVFFDTACLLVACCTPYNPYTSPGCCPPCTASAVSGKMAIIPGIAGNSLALTSMTGAFALLVGALAGLLPGPTITASGEWDDVMFFDCWISDIDHNHLVRVDTTQTHQGADLGLWQTSYPDTSSYAVVDFSGRGSIDPPNPRYGSDIVDVDSH